MKPEIEDLGRRISQYVWEANGESIEISLKEIQKPKDPQHGDLAWPCFPIAKLLKKSPDAVAAEMCTWLKNNYDSQESGSPWESIEPLRGFINFKVTDATIGVVLRREISAPAFSRLQAHVAQTDLGREKVMVEYSQPNTHKILHVGHIRNTVLGDTFVRFFRRAGVDVLAANYFGDEGTHIAKVLWWMEKSAQKAPPPGVSSPGHWLGCLYMESVQKLSELGEEETKQVKVDLGLIQSQIEKQSGPYFELWKLTREWSLQLFRSAYVYLDAGFNVEFFESELSLRSQEIVDEFYNKGIFVLSEGAIGCDLEAEGLGFMLLRKSDGNTLYGTKDLALAEKKFREHGVKKSIVVVGSEQNFHFKQVFACLEKMGFYASKDCYHLSYGHVRLPSGKMSSRLGNVIAFDDLRSAIETKLDEVMKPEAFASQAELEETRKQLTIAAIRYGMLQTDPSKDVVYDAEAWCSFEGHSGPYLVYTLARCHAILRKLNEREGSLQEAVPSSIAFAQLSEPEKALFWFFESYEAQLYSAMVDYKPSSFCHFLFYAAKDFNRFYATCPILNEPDLKMRNMRIFFVQSFLNRMSGCLELLGIPTVKKM